MKRTAIIAVILCSLASNVASQPNSTPAKKETGTEPKSPPSLALENKHITADHAEHSNSEPPKWYTPLERPDWWIVLIAGFTGLAIVYQAVEMKRATDVMRGQVQGIINAERAWILVDSILPPKDLYIRDRPHELMVMVLFHKFKVWGHTPIQVVEAACRFHLVNARDTPDGKRTEPDLPEVPDYGTVRTIDSIPELGKVLPPGKEFQSRVSLESNILSFEDFQDVLGRKQFLCTYGILKYRDAFDCSSIRETRFCYVYQVQMGLVLTDPIEMKQVDPDAFRIGGPSAYNGVT